MSVTRRLQLFGASLREIRHAVGPSQADVGRRIGRSQTFVSQVERGVAQSLNVADADRLCRALGATLVLGVDAPRLLDGGRPRDSAHAACVAHVERRMRNLGWQVEREVEIGSNRFPGWIDLLAWHPLRGTLLVVEVKTELTDIGAIERQLGRYTREASVVARRSGRQVTRVVPVLALLWSTFNDETIRRHGPAIAAAFPVRARALDHLAATGEPPTRSGPAVAMIDPRSRARRWARPTILDGRRSAAPYADYADFIRVGGRRRVRGRTAGVR